MVVSGLLTLFLYPKSHEQGGCSWAWTAALCADMVAENTQNPMQIYLQVRLAQACVLVAHCSTEGAVACLTLTR